MPNDEALQLLLIIQNIQEKAYTAGYQAGYAAGLTEARRAGLDRDKETMREIPAKEDSPDASDEK